MQVTGGINSNDMGTNHILHHTIGRSDSSAQEMEAFRPFVCVAVGAPLPQTPSASCIPRTYTCHAAQILVGMHGLHCKLQLWLSVSTASDSFRR